MIRKSLTILGLLLLMLLLSTSASANSDSPLGQALLAKGQSCTSPASPIGDGPDQHAVMHPDPATMARWQQEQLAAPRAKIDPAISRRLQAAAAEAIPTSMDLLAHIDYVPTDRDQGSCGNCWVWAGTGVAEIAHDVQNTVFDRLSIQFFNSCHSGYACCGGNLGEYANWYGGQTFMIPWSLTNASFADGGRGCSAGSSLVSCGSITTSPHYDLASIANETIESHSGQATAVSNIKNILNQNRGVYFGFALPTAPAWTDFNRFWNGANGETEATLWANMDGYCGTTWDTAPNTSGAHAVVILGYNDDDPNPDNHYWLVLNSWGTAAGRRPNGLFRIPQNLDYDCTYPNGDGGFWAFDLETLNIDFNPPEADLSISKSHSPEPAIAGEQLYYSVSVTNNGPGAAQDVKVTDVLPPEVDFETTTGTCDTSALPTLTCSVGDLDAAATRSFTIKVSVKPDVVANAGGPTTITNSASVATNYAHDAVPGNNQVSDVAIVEGKADLETSKECKPDLPLYAGGSGLCTITVHNWGPSDATNVTLTDMHMSQPGYFRLTPGSGALGCTFPSNPVATIGTITCPLGHLAAGNELQVLVGVSTDEGLDINDTATVTAAEADPNIGNNRASDGLTFIASADLALAKTATPQPVVAGTDLTYDLSVTNNGPSTAKNVVIKDVLPIGVSIVTVTSPDGTCDTGIPGNADEPTTCTFDTMVKGATKTMQVVVKVDPSFPGVLGNNASVSADTYDPNNSNNLATTATTVEGSADLSITKSDSPDPVLAGKDLTYDVRISNGGPSTAVGVALLDTLPTQVAFKSATVSGGRGTCSLLLPNSLSCNLNNLLPGDFVRVIIMVTVNPSTPNGTHIANTAVVSAATADPDPANNTASTDTTVNAQADLVISKTVRMEYTNPAPRIVWTVVVQNGGPSDAQTVVMTDKLPLSAKKMPYLYDTSAGKCVYTTANHTVSCNYGVLAAGASVSVDIWQDARGSVGVVTNTASVTTTTTDPNLANNTARRDVKIKGGPGPK